MIRLRFLQRAVRRACSALAMLVAALMLAAAPALAAMPAAGVPAPVHPFHAGHADGDACAEAGQHHAPSHDGAMPAHCLASCLAAMAVTSPVVPFANLPRPVLQGLPEARGIDALVPHSLPVDPPPPRLS
ncbi:hypothetical protein RXV95_04385 [Novosphingobium sp. ZN18A2]|uniref:hypothetical protein n=1 Tax=Novosphingobium sp. ZN18A2 TaxID=3079861 RepID=UPI0030D15E14